jgi:hypothetical protein
MELKELIFLGACAQLPKMDVMRTIGPDGGGISRFVHDDAAENILAVRRAEAVLELIVAAGI